MLEWLASDFRGLKPTRILIAFVAASILLPLIVSIGIFSAIESASRGQLIETLAMEKAQRVSSVVDVDLGRSIASIRAVATSQAVHDHDWVKARIRAQVIQEMNVDWHSVTLIDRGTGTTLFSTLADVPPLQPRDLDFLTPGAPVAIGGIAPRPGRCTCVLIAAPLAANMDRIVVVELDPERIQSILLADTARDTVTAVVDRKGNFIARSVDIAHRIGQPATRFVRDALAHGRSGFYNGKTYEGFTNRSAFVASPLTGWSVHIAVSSKLLSAPRRNLVLAIVLAGAAAVLFAAALAWLGLRAIAAQQRAEDRMRSAERMDALGKLTGGIAHDFNNMLAIIIGNLDLAQRRAAKGGDPMRFVDMAQEGARRAADLTRRMLTFSRHQGLESEVLATEAVIDDVTALLERTIGEHIALDTRIDDDVWPIHADRGQLENCLVNLAANARDAMPSGGSLTLGATNVATGGQVAGHRVAGDHVAVFVSDTGTGMSPETRQRALEPFFTTKSVGRGTGLGLSQVYGFVRHSGGELIIDSSLGKGTTIWVVLPRSAIDPATRPEDAAAAVPMAAGGLDIVLAEDDLRVQATTAAALEELGHRVRIANNGREALDLIAAGRPDLVISDILMPEMDGNQLAEQIAQHHAGLPVLFVSAYDPENPIPIADNFLRKPYTLDSLDAAITRLRVRIATPRP